MRRRGTEYEGVPELVPPGQSIPLRQPRGLANQGTGQTVVPSTEDIDHDSIMLRPLDANAVTTNISGACCQTAEINAVDLQMTTRALAYPGTSGAENNTQWEVPVPSRVHATAPGWYARIHMEIPS